VVKYLIKGNLILFIIEIEVRKELEGNNN